MTHERSSPGRHQVPEGLRLRRDYGQNFLVTKAVLERSWEYAKLGPTDSVLEIGPGLGMLTEQLAARAARVRSVEIDRQFEPHLTRLQRRFDNLEVEWGDALEANLGEFNKVVANLPYKSALPIILRLLEHDFEFAVLVIQQRLARRISARPGRDGYGRIGVTVQRLASVRLLELVKPHHFVPPPAVDSAIVRIRRVRPRFQVASALRFRRLLEVLFLQRNREVNEALKWLGEKEASQVGSLLDESLRRRRVFEVSPEEFGLIARRVDELAIRVPAVSDELKRKAQKYF